MVHITPSEIICFGSGSFSGVGILWFIIAWMDGLFLFISLGVRRPVWDPSPFLECSAYEQRFMGWIVAVIRESYVAKWRRAVKQTQHLLFTFSWSSRCLLFWFCSCLFSFLQESMANVNSSLINRLVGYVLSICSSGGYRIEHPSPLRNRFRSLFRQESFCLLPITLVFFCEERGEKAGKWIKETTHSK